MILLDTNVLSELLQPIPNPAVLAFVDRVPSVALFTSTITAAELFYGIALLPTGKRQEALLAGVERTLNRLFESGTLAALVGTVPSVAVGGAIALLVAAGCARVFPSLLRADQFRVHEPESEAVTAPA